MTTPAATTPLPEVLPRDDHNELLVSNVHPRDWTNPTPAGRYNLIVIGAGTAGLVTAAGAAGLGAKVALVEKHLMGGDCLNVGCVPSKAIIRTSRAAAEVHNAARFGIRVPEGTQVDFSTAMERMRRLRASISHNDSARRFQDLGVDVYFGQARFTSSDTINVDGTTLRFKKAVIATGARPAAPPIEGLSDAGSVTNETVFTLTKRPEDFVVIGGGPIGCELAQAFRRLGSHVTIIEMNTQFLSREDPDAAAILLRAFQRDGIDIRLNTSVKKVTVENGKKVVHAVCEGNALHFPADQILVGVGRAPNVDHLGLETAGVEYNSRTGVSVNDRLQTTNPRIFAAGDVAAKYKFTHTADATARIVIRNALFFGRARVSNLIVPWCTYTDPEIAHVGMHEHDAHDRGIGVDTFTEEFSQVDRAILDGEEEGFVRVHVKKGTDRILGATIVARHAGEMISEITAAMAGGIGLGKLSGIIHPYPTQTEAIKRVADAYMRTRLTPTVKKWFSRWFGWTR